ncbi:MAG TPA: SHOCT domain-containing protein [Actinomycetota bacterium]|nr:SHOCT domain-containing protein [Actinomycetota bacterium]
MGWGIWDHGWVGPLAMVLFWGLVVWLLLAAIRGPTPGSGRVARTDDPRNILAERFARGEISEEEYGERDAVLAGAPKRRWTRGLT